jgi:DNA-binding CsgD family transcriptional regulator
MPDAPSSDGHPPGGNGVPTLTDRDLEALRHLAEGRSTAQIAAAMVVSPNTVRTRIHRMEGKLAATDRGDVVPRARALGIL